MKRKETTSPSSTMGATGGARRKTTKPKDSDNTQLSDTAVKLQQQLQSVTELMSHDYNPRRQSSPAPPLQAPPLDSSPSSHVHMEMIKILKKVISYIEFQGKQIINLEESLLSMYKCVQNVERSIPQQRSVSPSPRSTSMDQTEDSLDLNAQTINSPQPQSSVDTQLSESAPQASALDPGQARAGRGPEQLGQLEQTHKIYWKTRRDEDLYYLRTIEVRGFSSEVFDQMIEDPTKSPYHWAKNLLQHDKNEGIIRRCRSVKFFRGGEGGRGPSFRATFDSIGEARRALTQAGAARNELRSLSSDTVLSYYQLTPPRFWKEKKKLYGLISGARKRGFVKNFYFLVVRNKLCALMKVPVNGGLVTTVPYRIRADYRGNLYDARYKTRLVTLSGDSYDDLIKVEYEEESPNRRAANENLTTDEGEDELPGHEE